MEWSSVKEESLVGTVVAHPPDKLVGVSVSVSSNIKAVSRMGSDVLSVSWVVRHSLVLSISPWSNNSLSSSSPSLSVLVGDVLVVLLPHSDGVGSSVHHEPLASLVSWDGVSDSELVVVVTNVVRGIDSSVTSQSRSDLEWSVVSPLMSSLVDDGGIQPEGRVLVSAVSPLDVVVSGSSNVNHGGAVVSDVSDVGVSSVDPS